MSTLSLPYREHAGPADVCCSLHYSPAARNHIQQAYLASAPSTATCCCTLHNNPLPKPLFGNDSTTILLSKESISSTKSESPAKDFTFWMIFFAVCITTLLVAIDLSIVSTALPTISEDLKAGELYVWVANAYVLASTSVQPLFGQAANIFGRRSLMIMSTVLFMAGSIFAGVSQTVMMMIAARTIQGIGGGGIITLGEIIVCDLLPLRERGQYTGLIAGTYAIGTIIGPVLGGVFVEQATWRWVFYINIPICAIALAIVIPFLKLTYNRVGTVSDRLKRVDWIGNFVLVAAVASILFALSYGGTKYVWTSWHIILPLVFGFIGLVLFAWIQNSGLVAEPTMPPQLFSNRTAVAIFAMAFVHGLLLLYVIYFFPVYSQAVLKASPIRAGVMLFPTATTIAPAAAAAGAVITITGRYRPLHFLGWTLMIIGVGLFPLLDRNSTTAAWVGYQALFGLGNGMVFNAMIPPLLASLPPSEVATATATWTFMRSFGSIWGIAIPSAIFNEKINSLSSTRLAGDLATQALLKNGEAYQHATAAFINSLAQPTQNIVIGIFVSSLRTVWFVAIAFAVLGLPISLLVRSLTLTDEYVSEFGIEDKKKVEGGMV
ncbi:MFS general substrate transporter [Mollisia scopiformis]|uniref:MFS general substrate transporter n=1 Tax=Mollisia scopiformis TaxID=149040 RepID=A0A194WX28_MOLSC|nr:MFS general substrate transporter [Mollisia scopiformis]KUJ12536.1 MFS general substrate transporter [Mollisia scopiformis]